jgi:hypothetical protein
MRTTKSTRKAKTKARAVIAITAAIAGCTIAPDAVFAQQSASATHTVAANADDSRGMENRPTHNDQLIELARRDCDDRGRPGKKSGKKKRAGKKRASVDSHGRVDRYAKMPGGPMRARVRNA